MRVTESYERWTRGVKQSVSLVGGGGGMGVGWDGGGQLAMPPSRLFQTHAGARAPARHQRPPTQQPNDMDAPPPGSVISPLTAPLSPSLTPPPPPYTPTPPTHEVKGGRDAVWNTNCPRLSQVVGARRQRRGMDGPGCRGPHGEQGGRVAAGYRWVLGVFRQGCSIITSSSDITSFLVDKQEVKKHFLPPSTPKLG